MITNKDLSRAVARLSGAIGAPPMAWKDGECPVGALQLVAGSRLYGRQWRLVRAINRHGGAETILSAPTKRELMEQLAAFMAGLQFAGRSSQREG